MAISKTIKNSNEYYGYLIDAPLDISVEVIQVQSGFRAAQRLSELGILPGTTIKKISQAPFRGPIQIQVRGTRLALGQGIAQKIVVKNC